MIEREIGARTLCVLAALATGLVLLLAGWWWAGTAVGLLLGLMSGEPDRAFWPVSGGVALAWLGLGAWQAGTNAALAAVGMVAGVAGLPAAAGVTFLLIPALLAAVAGGLAALGGAHVTS